MQSVASKVAAEKVYKSNCAICVNSCGLDVHVQGGKIVKVTGMKEHPLNKGMLCPRGQAIVEWEYSPQRLLHPMKKVKGQWQRITWDEALDTVATRLNELKAKYGPRNLAFQVGSIGNEDREDTELAQRFAAAFGTPNYLGPGNCYDDMIRSRMVTFGRFPFEEPDGSKCILLWAHNPSHSDPPKAVRILNSIRQGGKLVVINPKRIPMSKEAIHLSPRPGTDLALAMGMLHVIIKEGLYDRGFVEKWTLGFDKLAEHVEQYTPEKVSTITSVPAEDIIKVARLFATSKPACIVQSTCALGQTATGFQADRAFSILQTVTGNVYNEGTWIRVPMPYWPREHLEVEGKPIGAEEHPLAYELWGRRVGMGHGMYFPDAVLDGKPYPIKSLILVAANFGITQPDSHRFQEAFKKLEFFAAIDIRMNETMELAQIVLPAATFLEKWGLGYSYSVVQGIPYISLRPKTIEPLGEARAEFWIWTELARRIGLGHYFPWKTEEEFVDWELKDMNLSVKKLQELPSGGLMFAKTKYGEESRKEKGFPTPSGKIELFSETLLKYGYDPMPTFHEPSESPVSNPKLAKEYPIILITGSRDPQYSHSGGRYIDKLRKRSPEPLVEINPKTAEELGVADGEMVAVESKKGSITLKARVTEDMMPGVVHIPHGWAKANVNYLTDYKLKDPITGIPQLKAILCRVKKLS